VRAVESVFPARPGRDWLWCAGESFQCMGRDSVELVRRAYLAWQEGDLEGLLSRPAGHLVSRAPLPRRAPNRGRSSGGAPLVSVDPDHLSERRAAATALRGPRPAGAGARTAGRREQARGGRPRRGGGVGVDRLRRTHRRHAGVPRRACGTPSDPRPRLTPSTAFERSRHCRRRSARSPHCRRNPKRALRGHAGATPPAVPRDPGPIQRARRPLLARGRTPAPDTRPPPETNDRDGPHIRKRRRPEPARRSGISTRRGQEDDQR
jgi:hypothetical protein